MKKDFKTLKVKADIHADGDVYIYNEKENMYHRIGILIPDDISYFSFDKEGELVSAPVPNPCYQYAKKILNKDI